MRCLRWGLVWVLAVLVNSGCSKNPSTSAEFSKHEAQIERFEGIARDTKMGACLDTDDGRRVWCVVDTDGGGNQWADDAKNKRVQVEGYRIRGRSDKPNEIMIRCVNWTQIGATLKQKPPGKTKQSKK